MRRPQITSRIETASASPTGPSSRDRPNRKDLDHQRQLVTPSPAPAGYEPVGLRLETPRHFNPRFGLIHNARVFVHMYAHAHPAPQGQRSGRVHYPLCPRRIHCVRGGEPTARANRAAGLSGYISAAVRSRDGASGSKRGFPRVQHDCHVGRGAPPASHSLKGLDGSHRD
jgi:hypothetical protein